MAILTRGSQGSHGGREAIYILCRTDVVREKRCVILATIKLVYDTIDSRDPYEEVWKGALLAHSKATARGAEPLNLMPGKDGITESPRG
jgi:hypothetical protein